MSQTKAHPSQQTLYKKHGINPTFDVQGAYGYSESHYGKGRYPPDWSRRRDAVWERQKYQCGRCDRYKGDVSVAEVHHIIHLNQGGSNGLGNLVGLCGPCHALMHPSNGDMQASYHSAPIYPASDAQNEVAVIRNQTGDERLDADIGHMAAESDLGNNKYAHTDATAPTSPSVARRAKDDLHALCIETGHVPRSSAYRRVRVEPTQTGYLGAISRFTPSIEARSNGELAQVSDWNSGLSQSCDVHATTDTTAVRVSLTDGVDETTTTDVDFAGESQDNPVTKELEPTISPPPLGLRTLPGYLYGATLYFGYKGLKWGLVPAILVALAFPSLLSSEGALFDVLMLALMIGVVLRVAYLPYDVESAPAEEAETATETGGKEGTEAE